MTAAVGVAVVARAADARGAATDGALQRSDRRFSAGPLRDGAVLDGRARSRDETGRIVPIHIPSNSAKLPRVKHAKRILRPGDSLHN